MYECKETCPTDSSPMVLTNKKTEFRAVVAFYDVSTHQEKLFQNSDYLKLDINTLQDK